MLLKLSCDVGLSVVDATLDVVRLLDELAVLLSLSWPANNALLVLRFPSVVARLLWANVFFVAVLPMVAALPLLCWLNVFFVLLFPKVVVAAVLLFWFSVGVEVLWTTRFRIGFRGVDLFLLKEFDAFEERR
jgi:hypothetical protein